MIEPINLTTFEIPHTYVLVKCDANYDFHEIATPDGKVELQLSYFHQDRAKHLSISGTVIKLPNDLFFFEGKNKLKERYGYDFEARMRNTAEFRCQMEIEEGDRVYFSYTNQLDAEMECRLVKTPEHGICMLIKYSGLYAKVVGEELYPLNGWVFFKRDQADAELKTDSGLILLQKEHKYDSEFGTVLYSGARIEEYLEKEVDPNVNFTQDERIIIDKRWGVRISYELGNEDIQGVEAIRRKNILALA